MARWGEPLSREAIEILGRYRMAASQIPPLGAPSLRAAACLESEFRMDSCEPRATLSRQCSNELSFSWQGMRTQSSVCLSSGNCGRLISGAEGICGRLAQRYLPTLGTHRSRLDDCSQSHRLLQQAASGTLDFSTTPGEIRVCKMGQDRGDIFLPPDWSSGQCSSKGDGDRIPLAESSKHHPPYSTRGKFFKLNARGRRKWSSWTLFCRSAFGLVVPMADTTPFSCLPVAYPNNIPRLTRWMQQNGGPSTQST